MANHIIITQARLDELIAEHQVLTWHDEIEMARQVADDAGYEYEGDYQASKTDNIVYDLAHTIVRLADTIHRLQRDAARSQDAVAA